MKIILLLLSLFMLNACSHVKYIYVVRHAEKLDNTPYSVLSAEGHQRAQVLRDSLIDKRIDRIFATFFQRTQETAKPLADALHEPIALYRNNAVDSIVAILNKIKNRNILLVGHSGNLPSIIEKLANQKINPIGESEYDNIYIIKTKKGKTWLTQKKYGSTSR